MISNFAVVCGESSLGYTCLARIILYDLAVVCGESSLGYTTLAPRDDGHCAVVCGESSLGYTLTPAAQEAYLLWFAGNRRSDTLDPAYTSQTCCCGLRGIVARIHSKPDCPT